MRCLQNPDSAHHRFALHETIRLYAQIWRARLCRAAGGIQIFSVSLCPPWQKLFLNKGGNLKPYRLQNCTPFCFPAALVIGACGSAAAAESGWQSYAVYQPRITHATVVDPATHPLRYNHDSSVAWFGDRWFCLWNANTTPAEGAPGQLNYASTSRDGMAWSEPEPVFADPARSVNPVPCPQGTQWQPNLLVIANRLWCFWSQHSKDEHHGCYLSILDAPDGVWTNRLLTWEGRADPLIDGKSFRLFPTQNPLLLSSGRILAPLTMIGPPVAAAPPGSSAWYRAEKRNSVLYSDDHGATWQLSPGTVLPALEWRQWEPTLCEQPDGSVLMFARNNLIPSYEGGRSAAPEEALVWSLSHDGGATWSPHAYVPLQSVVSRMHLLRQPDSERYLLIHNDWHSGRWGADRRNLALFFNRGGGIDFTAGLGLTPQEPEVAYPQLGIHRQTLLVGYSQGPVGQRGIRIAAVTPLPDPEQLYLLPRSNLPAPPRAEISDGSLHLEGGASLRCRAAPVLPPQRLTLEAWVNPVEDGVIFDNRSAAAGFVWALSGVALIHCGDPAHNIRSALRVPRGRWSRIGVSIDYPRGEIIFAVNGQTERVTFQPGRRSLNSPSATLFGPNPAASSLSPFEGAVRALTLDGTNHLFDAVVTDALQTNFIVPELHAPASAARVEYLRNDTPHRLRICGPASTGVELSANERRAGDTVQIEFAFSVTGTGDGALCTVGDANQPARVVVRGDTILLESGGISKLLGKACAGERQWLRMTTGGNRSAATLDNGAGEEVLHNPEATWVYLGEGFPGGRSTAGCFDVDVASVRSRVIAATE